VATNEAPPPSSVTKLLLTPTEAALALGIGRSKLYELIRAGVVESVLIGSSRRIPTAAVARYVEVLTNSTPGLR
jgi:excisionase family DNA binding protein